MFKLNTKLTILSLWAAQYSHLHRMDTEWRKSEAIV